MSSATTVTSRLQASGPSEIWRLLLVFGPEQERLGTAHVLSDSPVTIGREGASEDHFVLDDAELSREHARIEPSEQGWELIDLDSHNGTYVNAARVDRKVVVHGDVIRLGANLLVLQRISLDSTRDLVLAGRGRSTLVGGSVVMASLRAEIGRVAPGLAPVLVIGESGVGKELVARELHDKSGRKGPLVPMNAAALPEQLAESELFGHAPGAYTGASGRGKGLFDEAEGGTLFMDEIGEMPMPLQAKLLRALATGEVRSVGDSKSRTADVRVVAATNVDLENAIDDGTFRGDLYARLAGEIIDVSPLRDRREDIFELGKHFLSRAKGLKALDVDVVEALMVHPWRFNVRELEQAIRSAASRAEGAEKLELGHLPPKLREPLLARATDAGDEEGSLPLHLRVRPDAVPSAEELETVLRELGGNVKQVATFFGRHRAQIYRWAERLEVDVESYRA